MKYSELAPLTPPQLALVVALNAHSRQRRRFTAEPYINHPLRVARMATEALLRCFTQQEIDNIYCAALLHDAVEDTLLTNGFILEHFGPTVAWYVFTLTERRYGKNRAERKQAHLEVIERAPMEVQTIKLADMVDNMPSIIQHDPKFAATYMRECREITGACSSGESSLRTAALDIINNYFK